MQNRTFLVVLRPIFCEKLKTAPPPHRKTAPLKRLDFRFGPKKQSQIRWRAFYFYFWRPPDFGRKNRLNFRFRPKNQSQIRWRPSFFFFFFFWRPPDFGRKKLSEKFRINFRTNRAKLIQEQWKFGSRSFAHFLLFQNSPPPPLFQILATRLPRNQFYDCTSFRTPEIEHNKK